MDCTGVYDTDGNLTNVTISAEKKAEILSSDFTGSGTSTDPYQVNSSLGFWYMSKFVTLTNCYVELNCDVILNDETFDENGNASVGDGVVYEWKPITGAVGASIYGNNNTIFGLYFNDKDYASGVYLFNSHINKALNMQFANFFISAKGKISSLCYYAEEVKNCVAKSGNFKAGGYVAGMVLESSKINNCINYINMSINNIIPEDDEYYYFVERGFSGMICYGKDKISNCKNFGNIYGDENCSGIAFYFRDGEISNCVNYGNVRTITDYRAAGIVERLENGNVINCVNYGNVSAASYTYSTPDARGCAIVNYMWRNVSIIGCKNYGLCCGSFANVDGGAWYNETNILIENCYSESATCFLKEISFVGGEPTESKIFDIKVKNCVFVNYSSNLTCFFTDYMKFANLSIDGFVAKINSSNCSLIGDVYSKFGTEKATVKNLLIENQANGYNGNLFYKTKDAKLSRDFFSVSSLIVINADTKQYYGSNFSGFYIAWRTGKIGLKALDGVGYFQGAIDEEWLANNGFVKKN